MTIRIGIVGFGKIARDEHVPAIRADGRYRLVAIATRSGDPRLGVPCYSDLSEMIAAMPGGLDAVALCTPPEVRFALATEAIAAGLGVLLEKPPSLTLGEIAELERLARAAATPLYTAWHSQHAAGVERAAQALLGEQVQTLTISWCEDVRKWHPGQQWIWQPGGFGVFDPGINALSIASRILPGRLLVASARLLVPANCQTPIAAEIEFAGGSKRARFDWRVSGGEQWSIMVETATGSTIELHGGGERLVVDGADQLLPQRREYPSIYDRFAKLMQQALIEVDAEPLRICADAFLCANRETVDPFVE